MLCCLRFFQLSVGGCILCVFTLENSNTTQLFVDLNLVAHQIYYNYNKNIQEDTSAKIYYN